MRSSIRVKSARAPGVNEFGVQFSDMAFSRRKLEFDYSFDGDASPNELNNSLEALLSSDFSGLQKTCAALYVVLGSNKANEKAPVQELMRLLIHEMIQSGRSVHFHAFVLTSNSDGEHQNVSVVAHAIAEIEDDATDTDLESNRLTAIFAACEKRYERLDLLYVLENANICRFFVHRQESRTPWDILMGEQQVSEQVKSYLDSITRALSSHEYGQQKDHHKEQENSHDLAICFNRCSRLSLLLYCPQVASERESLPELNVNHETGLSSPALSVNADTRTSQSIASVMELPSALKRQRKPPHILPLVGPRPSTYNTFSGPSTEPLSSSFVYTRAETREGEKNAYSELIPSLEETLNMVESNHTGVVSAFEAVRKLNEPQKTRFSRHRALAISVTLVTLVVCVLLLYEHDSSLKLPRKIIVLFVI